MLLEDKAVEASGCANCGKIADSISAWDKHYQKPGENSAFCEAISPWQDFVNAKDCTTCALLVRTFHQSHLFWEPQNSSRLYWDDDDDDFFDEDEFDDLEEDYESDFDDMEYDTDAHTYGQQSYGYGGQGGYNGYDYNRRGYR